MRHVRFPPGRYHLRVPGWSRRAAKVGLSLYTPCTRKGIWLQRATWWAVTLLGPSALLGSRAAWQPPMQGELWSELVSAWSRRLGPVEGWALYQPRQLDRPRLAMVPLGQDRPLGFIKLRWGEREAVEREAWVLEALAGTRPGAFRVPGLVDVGRVGDWHYLVLAPLPSRRHLPFFNPPLAEIVEEIQGGLAGLARPPGTPAHWAPMHGDLAVWNLRRFGSEDVVLVDWEHAGWAPPGADEVFFRVTTAALMGGDPGPTSYTEAVEFWRGQDQFGQPTTDNLDREFAAANRSTLQRMSELS